MAAAQRLERLGETDGDCAGAADGAERHRAHLPAAVGQRSPGKRQPMSNVLLVLGMELSPGAKVERAYQRRARVPADGEPLLVGERRPAAFLWLRRRRSPA